MQDTPARTSGMRAEVTNQWAEEGHGGGGGSWTEPGSWG